MSFVRLASGTCCTACSPASSPRNRQKVGRHLVLCPVFCGEFVFTLACLLSLSLADTERYMVEAQKHIVHLARARVRGVTA